MGKVRTPEEQAKIDERMAKMRAARVAKQTETKAEPEVELTDDQKIVRHYQKAEGSIQDIARVYKVSVEHVLDLIGQGDIIEIQTRGDLIDQDEAGREVKVNPYGTPVRQSFTVN